MQVIGTYQVVTNLRKRVAATALQSVANVNANPNKNREAASYYSYDITGNVHKTVFVQVPIQFL